MEERWQGLAVLAAIIILLCAEIDYKQEKIIEKDAMIAHILSQPVPQPHYENWSITETEGSPLYLKVNLTNESLTFENNKDCEEGNWTINGVSYTKRCIHAN